VFDATNVSIRNFEAVIAGQTVAFAGAASGNFGWDNEDPRGPPWPYDFVAGAGSVFFSDGLALSNVSGDQFQQLHDPLGHMLLNAPHLSAIFGSIPSGAGLGAVQGWHVSGTFTVTPVPAPGAPSLFLAGMVGLALSRRRNH